MTEPNNIFCLKIDSPLVTSDRPNFSPDSWPPTHGFPIVVDASGKVISSFGDPTWDLTTWCNRVTTINFEGSRGTRSKQYITGENSTIFQTLAAWWLYGPNRSINGTGLARRCEIVKPIFFLCSAHNISATSISRYPKLIEELSKVLTPSSASYALTMLHDAWEQRESIGFHLLDSASLSKLADLIVKHERDQTPYIPPRIWLHQVNQLREFLEDFNRHSQEIEACFNFCLEAYAFNAGSLEKACQFGLTSFRHPFQSSSVSVNGKISGARYYGPFYETARRFGIDTLLYRWVPNFEKHGPSALSTYFNMISALGAAYLINFSITRHSEGFSFRQNCLLTERDPVTGEDIFILKGETTKTIEDDDAHWITSPSSKIAVDAMRTVSKLRMIAAEANPGVPVTQNDRDNPLLVLRAYEPWRKKSDHFNKPMNTKLTRQHYSLYVKRYNTVFDHAKLRITEEDLIIARQFSPSLNPDQYSVGKVWPFSWHQLRRTGAVNMSASGLVSDASGQYQLKHATRGMTRYYGQGFYRLNVNLNQEVRTEYIKTMYEMIGREFSSLLSTRFISPHGEKRKDQILNIVREKDHDQLIKAAKDGRISFRPNFLGVCTYRGHCPYGGIETVARCGGGDGRPPCEDVLYDLKKLPAIEALARTISSRLDSAPDNTPLQRSLTSQKKAIENALYVLKSL